MNLAAVPTPGQSVLLMSCSLQLGPSLGSAGAGWGEESRVDGGVAVVPTPLALPSPGTSCLESQPPGPTLAGQAERLGAEVSPTHAGGRASRTALEGVRSSRPAS